MLENGFYKVTQKFIDLSRKLGETYKDANKREIEIIRRKLSRIILVESKHPNKYEQHITSIKEYLLYKSQ